jgi:hypothetical protein
MTEERKFDPECEEQEIWLTEDEVKRLLLGTVSWDEFAAERRRLAAVEQAKSEALAAAAAVTAVTAGTETSGTPKAASPTETGTGASGTPKAEAAAEMEKGTSGTPKAEAAAEAETGISGAPKAEAAAEAEAVAPPKKMPWDYTDSERDALWQQDTSRPDWLDGDNARFLDFDSNEMKRLLTEEPAPRASIWRGARLVGLMLVLAAATFGVWWYFVY